jgi:hypothetical protein
VLRVGWAKSGQRQTAALMVDPSVRRVVVVTSSPTRVRSSSRSCRAATLTVALLDVAGAEIDVVALVVEEMPDDPEDAAGDGDDLLFAAGVSTTSSSRCTG